MTVNKKNKQKTRVNVIGGVNFRKFGMEWTFEMSMSETLSRCGKRLRHQKIVIHGKVKIEMAAVKSVLL